MMKILICFIVFLVSCVSLKKSPVRIPFNEPMANAESALNERRDPLRTSEVVKAYPIGRYIESDSGRVMHEKHTVYRVEEDADWNLPSEGRQGGGNSNSTEGGYPITKNAELHAGHFAALVEQNAVLEKKIRALEYNHAQCGMQHGIQPPQLDKLKVSLSPPPSLQAENVEKNRLFFRMESFPLSKDSSKPSFSSAE